MGKTNIEWATDSWQATYGCSVVSPGCSNCYAMKMAGRLEAMGQATYRGLTQHTKAGAVWNGSVRAAGHDALTQPLRWRKPRRIFVDSMADLFAEGVEDEWIDRAFAVMALCPQHTFQVLTKRPERMREYIAARSEEKGQTALVAAFPFTPLRPRDNLNDEVGKTLYAIESVVRRWPLPNIWLGTSVEDRARLSRMDDLRATPAAVRFVSAEPLLEDLGTLNLTGIHQVIVGGESGPRRRVVDLAWARSIRDQCQAADVKFFMKQVDKVAAIPPDLMIREMP